MLGKTVDTNSGILEVGKGVRNTSSFTVVVTGPPVVSPGDESNKSLLLLKTGVGVETKMVVSSTSWLLLLGLGGEGEGGKGEKTELEVASATRRAPLLATGVVRTTLETLLDTNSGIVEVVKGIRNKSSFTVVDGTIALVVSGSELEGETMSDEEREGEGVKTMDEGRTVVWVTAAEELVGENSREGIGELLACMVDFTMGRGVVSGDGGRGREGEAAVSMVNDDVMSNILGSSGSSLPLPVIPALGGEEGQKGTSNTPNHNYQHSIH